MEDPSNPLIEGELADKDGFSLIDGSELEDLFVSMSVVTEPRLVDNKANIVDGGVNMLERPEAEKPRKNEKYNLRKSLAWDSAFFTSAGVLDAEELSSIMDGGNGGKHQMHHLPGIQEDISKSSDSLSTLGSDNLTIESLEADLFSDIRASIQRSSESSKLRKSNLNGRPLEPSQLGKKTTEIKHVNMVKSNSTPKKLNTNLQGDGKLMKLGPSREQPMVSRREPSSSLLKPAAASGKGSSKVMAPARVPTKRMSISAGRIKSDNNNVGSQTTRTAAGRVTNVSKGDRPGDSSNIIPKAASYAKSSLGSSTTNRTGISSARSSIDSTCSSSSQGSRILPLNGLQGKTNRPVSIPPPGVQSRIPSRFPLKGKNPPSSSRISAKLSASMLSPTVSPTSSISEWSSSSSTLTANQENRDCSSLHRTFSLDSNASQDLQIHSNERSSCENEIEVAGVPGISAQELSAGNASISNPVSAKPSGLRMPSPKIGFFDGVKSGGRTQNAVGSLQSRSRLSNSRLPRSITGSSSPGGVPNKGRMGNSTVKTTALAAAKANPGTPRSNARMTATGGGRLEGIMTAPNKESIVRACEDVTKTAPLKTNEDNNSAATKLPVGEKHHSEPGSRSRKKSGLVSPSKNATPEEKSHFHGNQVSSAVEADHQIMEMNDDSKVPSAQLLHESINGDTVNTELHPIMSEKVGNAIKVDENADIVVLNGGCEANNEKNDPIYVVITDQQNVFAEQQVNGLIANVEAVGNKQLGLCDEMDGKFEPHSNVNSVSDSHSPAVSCTAELSGLDRKGEEADLPKQTDLSVSLKMLESKPGARTPLADKNSSPDAYAIEVLLKKFTSLSLDNVQAKDVETGMT